MALVVTHPDYARNERLVHAYRHLLEEFAHDPTSWKALPRDVSSWWRERGASTLARTPDGWAIKGPAEDRGAVVFSRASAVRAA